VTAGAFALRHRALRAQRFTHLIHRRRAAGVRPLRLADRYVRAAILLSMDCAYLQWTNPDRKRRYPQLRE